MKLTPSQQQAADLIALIDQAAEKTGLAKSTVCAYLKVGGDFYTRLQSGKYRGNPDTVAKIKKGLRSLKPSKKAAG